MRKSRRPIVIASRQSRLARAQAEAVGSALSRLHPTIEVHYKWILTEGDQQVDRDLSSEGGKGLFVKAVEQALLREDADLAVHSLKDLPVRATTGLVLAAVPARGDARDCLVARNDLTSIDQLPHGAIVGTSSPRRAAQLKRLRPDLSIQPLRGNVETRLRKVLQERAYDATLLSVAGLQRCGLSEHAGNVIDPSLVLPAAGQGALALQCRMDDHVTLTRCLPLNDTVTGEAVHAERQIVAGLEGDCHSPIAVYAEPLGSAALEYVIRVRVLAPDDGACVELVERSAAKRVRRLVKDMIASLKTGGAPALLARASAAAAQEGAHGPPSTAGMRFD